MEFALRIIDKSSLLSDLDLYQIERVVWLRLASVEHRVRGVKMQISMDPSKPDQLYSIQLFTKLDSGHTVVTQLRRKTVGDVVLNSVSRMACQVARRIKYERSFLFRMTYLLRQRMSILTKPISATTANCES